MAREDAEVINEFKEISVNYLKDVMMVLPAIIPQTKDDKELFREGLEEMAKLVYDLENAETIRELSRFMDVQKIAEDFDMNTIKQLDQSIRNTARQSVLRLGELYSDNGDDLNGN